MCQVGSGQCAQTWGLSKADQRSRIAMTMLTKAAPCTEGTSGSLPDVSRLHEALNEIQAAAHEDPRDFKVGAISLTDTQRPRSLSQVYLDDCGACYLTKPRIQLVCSRVSGACGGGVRMLDGANMLDLLPGRAWICASLCEVLLHCLLVSGLPM